MGVVYPWQTNAYFPKFYFLWMERAMKQRLPLLQLKSWGLMLLAHCWKCALQLITCRGDANGSSFTTDDKHPFAHLLLFETGKSDEATSPSFVAKIGSIDASNLSLETPIATHRM